MLIEDLLSRLSCEYSTAYVIFFSDEQVRLSEAQKKLYNNVLEKNWNDITEDRQEETSINVLSFPLEAWPDNFALDNYVNNNTKVYLLLSKKLVEETNKLLSHVASPAFFINKIYNFSSLEQDYCVEIISSESVKKGYLEKAASEYVYERIKRKELKAETENLISVNAKLAQNLEGTSTKLKETYAELEKITAKLEETTIKRDTAVAQLEEINVKYEEIKDKENLVQSEKKALEKKINDLQAALINVNAELEYHKDRSRLIKSTASYRFGNLFVNAARSPQKLLLLPYDVIRFFIVGFFKKIKARKKNVHRGNTNSLNSIPANENSSSNAGKKKSLYGLLQRISIDDEEKLAAYLVDSEPKKKWVGIISSRTFLAKLGVTDDVIQLHPNTWKFLFKKSFPSIVFIEASSMGEGSSWSSCLEGGAYGYPNHLIEMLSYCREKSITAILWDNRESVYGNVSEDLLIFLNKVYVSDKEKVKNYSNCCETKVELLKDSLDGHPAELIHKILISH